MASIAGGVIDELDEDSLRGTPQDDNDDEAEWIYVLELEDGCFYVGKTSNPDARLEQHRNLGRYTGAAWTRLHPPTTTGYLVCRQVKKEYSGLEEDALTQMWMMKKGIDKVRGGSYSQCVLPGHQLKTLQQAAWHCMGACTGCGADDHWVEQCDQMREFGVKENGGGGNGSADGLETRIDHRRKGSGIGAEETSAPALRSEEPFSFPSAKSFGASNSFGAPAAAVSFGAPAAASSGGNGGSQFDNGGGGVGSTEHKEAKKTTTKKTGARYKVIKVQAEGLISQPNVCAQAAVKLYNEAWKCEPTPLGATASTALTKCAEALQQQVQEAIEEGYFPCGAATHVTIKHQRHHDGSGMTSYQHFMTQAMLKQAILPVAPVETFLF